MRGDALRAVVGPVAMLLRRAPVHVAEVLHHPLVLQQALHGGVDRPERRIDGRGGLDLLPRGERSLAVDLHEPGRLGLVERGNPSRIRRHAAAVADAVDPLLQHAHEVLHLFFVLVVERALHVALVLRRVVRARLGRLGHVRAPEVLPELDHPQGEVVDLRLPEPNLLELRRQVATVRVTADVVVNRAVGRVACGPDPLVPRIVGRAERHVVVVGAEGPRLVRVRSLAKLVHAGHVLRLGRVPGRTHEAVRVGDDRVVVGSVDLLVRKAALFDKVVAVGRRVAKPMLVPDVLRPRHLESLVRVHELAVLGVVPVRHRQLGGDRLDRELELVRQRGVLGEEAHAVVEPIGVPETSGCEVAVHKLAEAPEVGTELFDAVERSQ
mmetsp:Transcript_23090/g.61519  ORF Transcript_23090/g.61519 Transcript_23090/m.61519 type:complete len:381 (+) Transcript_23090:1106-2248(+)